jgi:hypothetical protein
LKRLSCDSLDSDFCLAFFSVSIYEESPRDKTYWTSTDTGV